MSLRIRGLRILTSRSEANLNTERTFRSSTKFCIAFFPNANNRAMPKLLVDFAVDKPTWIRTFKQHYHQIEEIFQMLDSRISPRGYKDGARLQRKRAYILPKISKSKNARLRKRKTGG